MTAARPCLRIGHSPDPDDAFMWWPLLAVDGGAPRLEADDFRFESVAEDIEALNRRAEEGTLEITAMSCAQYPRVQRRYALTACGASLGDGYGPRLVARVPLRAEALRADASGAPVIAVPGERTSAFAALRLLLAPGTFRHEVVPFEEIVPAVASGAFPAGLVIHEGQLTFADAGLHLVADLGAWWRRRTGRPIPLGVNAIRRDLDAAFGAGTLAAVTATLRRSVEYALAHRDDSIAYALRFARGLDARRADAFVAMYVNRWTLDFGPSGREAVRVFLAALATAGLVPEVDDLDVVPATS